MICVNSVCFGKKEGKKKKHTTYLASDAMLELLGC